MRGLKRKNIWVMEQQAGPGGWEMLSVSRVPANFDCGLINQLRMVRMRLFSSAGAQPVLALSNIGTAYSDHEFISQPPL